MGEERGQPPGPIRVLHVEDEPGFSSAVREYLEGEIGGFSVEAARDIGEGLEVLADGETDCVISDHVLPDGSGVEFLETVRADHPHLPFVILTARGSERIASDAISAGVTDYIEKEGSTEQYARLANTVENAVERRRAERDLAAARERTAFALDTTNSVVFEADLETGEEIRHGPFERLYGVPSDEVATTAAFYEECVHPEDQAQVERLQQPDAFAACDAPIEYEFRTHPKHGDVRWMRTEARADVGDDGDLQRLVGINTEVTERKRLRETYELVVEASTDAFWEWDPDTGSVTRSDEFLVRFGYGEEDIGAGTDWWADRIHPEDRSHVLDARDRALEDPEATYDETYRFRRADGAYGSLRSRGVVTYDQNGAPERMVGAHVDMTELAETRRRLEEKNERLERFASVVSHDLRNPLNVVEGRVELAREECDSDHLDAAATALDRSHALIEDLLTLAREGDSVGDLEPVVLADLADRCWSNVETAAARLVVESDRTIQADASRLRQLVENLMRNAVEHGTDADDGTRSSAGDGETPAVTVTIGDVEDGFYVEDDGVGIPETERERVFEAGYSTAGEGTGFGLSIVEEIAAGHGWAVEATESADGGARFEITGVEQADPSQSQ